MVVARWFAARGWPYAESTGAARQGADLTGTPDIAVEVKARANFDPLAWVRQAVKAAEGRLPFVVMRCNGQGEAAVEDWVCLVRLGDLTELLRAAGYGDGRETGAAGGLGGDLSAPGAELAPEDTPTPERAAGGDFGGQA